MSVDNGRHRDPVLLEMERVPLPRGWARTTVGELGDIRLGRQRSPKNRSSSFPTKYVRAANLTWGGLDLSDVLDMDFRPSELSSYRLLAGDVLLSEASGSAGEVGKSAIWKDEIENCCFQNTVIRFRPNAVTSEFARLAFLYFAKSMVFARVSKGVGIHHLSADRFSSLPLLLPPISEQRRIVEKIEQLFSELDAGVAALKRAKANLKRYRASVLKAAVDGSLTAAWRAEHTEDEPASELLERILAERRCKWEANQLAKYKTADKEPPKNWRAKYVQPAPPDTAGLPVLPKSWCWARLEAVADVMGGLTKDQKRAQDDRILEVLYLRVANVQRGFLDLDEVKLIHASQADVESLRLFPGDVLFTEGGDRDKLGRGWVWNGELRECIHQNHIFRARLYAEDMQPELVSHHGNSFGKLWFTRAGKQTTNLASINLSILRGFPIPVAPVEEQAQVVAMLAERLSQMDAAETAISDSLARAARLRQSILKKAFEGKLVAQDHADESAAELLTRIQRQRNVRAAESATEATKEPKEVFVRRAAVVTYTVQRLWKHPSFGRTQLEKTLHLAQSHVGVDLGLTFERQVAGPFDKVIYKLEGVARKNDWFVTQKRPKCGVTYRPGTKSDSISKYAVGHLGARQAEFDQLLGHISQMNTDEAELFATVYAAWNDLLIDGAQVDGDAIITEVHAWHEAKKRFTPEVIRARIRWMRQHGYVPTGQGEHTSAPTTPVKPKRRKA